MTEIRCAVEFREDETRKGPGRLTGTLIRYGDTSGQTRDRGIPARLAVLAR